MPGVTEAKAICAYGYQKKSDAVGHHFFYHHFIRFPKILRVSSLVAVRVAVLTALLVTFLPMESLERLG